MSPRLVEGRNLAIRLVGAANETFIPHMSLAYGVPVPFDAIADLVGRAIAPVSFDWLQVVSVPDINTSQDHIRQWRYGRAFPMGGR